MQLKIVLVSKRLSKMLILHYLLSVSTYKRKATILHTIKNWTIPWEDYRMTLNVVFIERHCDIQFVSIYIESHNNLVGRTMFRSTAKPFFAISSVRRGLEYTPRSGV